jgi:hypothetical protein
MVRPIVINHEHFEIKLFQGKTISLMLVSRIRDDGRFAELHP